MGLVASIEVDAFEVEVERSRVPGLRGRPVVVVKGELSRGIVISVSHEARQRGIRRGMPCSAVRRMAPDMVFLPENRKLYDERSRLLMQYLVSEMPGVEKGAGSVWLIDLAGCERWMEPLGGPLGWAEQVRQRVWKEVGLPVAVGLAPGKLLARAASRLARPSAALWVREGCESDFIANMHVRLLPAWTRETGALLSEADITTAGELRQQNEETLRWLLGGERGSALWKQAWGICNAPIKPAVHGRHLEQTYLFQPEADARDMVKAAMVWLAGKLLHELRRSGAPLRRITLIIDYADGFHSQREVSFYPPATDERESAPAIERGVEQLLQRRVRVRSAAIQTTLLPAEDDQADLFFENERQKRRRYSDAIEDIRMRYGYKALIKGSAMQPARKMQP